MATIMLVDDSKFMRIILSRCFAETSHEIVAEAFNELEAISMYQQCRPDLVFMDITMPEMNGIETLKHIVEIDPKAKVIMCSAIGQQWAIRETLQLGAREFIIKPFQQEKVLEAAAKTLCVPPSNVPWREHVYSRYK